MGQYSEIIHDSCFIFSGQINFTWNLCALSGYLERLTFSLKNMTFILKFMTGPLLLNYKWQLLHILRTYQPIMGPVHSRAILTILTFDHDIMIIILKILLGQMFKNYKRQLLHILRAYQWSRGRRIFSVSMIQGSHS